LELVVEEEERAIYTHNFRFSGLSSRVCTTFPQRPGIISERPGIIARIVKIVPGIVKIVPGIVKIILGILGIIPGISKIISGDFKNHSGAVSFMRLESRVVTIIHTAASETVWKLSGH